jgi:hypothetical protein
MMKHFTACMLSLLSIAGSIKAQNYSNNVQQSARINALATAHPQLAKVKSIAKTAGGKDVWLITIGTGNTEAKPAIAVIGGVEGNHLLGTELAIGFAENILQAAGSDSIKALLNKSTFYVFPNMSPDAMEQYFATLKYERQGNASATDDDRDGKVNEDMNDDLDGNGKINWMRVESPIGEYRVHPDDPRILIKADFSKGEKGTHLLLSEGIDNDKDGQFNEDGEGGVWFNKNLTYRHPSFTVGSGEFPVSENESRALLDTLFNLFNVHTVVSFGSNNNLSLPVVYNAANANQRIPAGWLEQDAKQNAMVSELYNKITSLKDGARSTPAGGDVFSWAYFHYGRYSFSTPGWWVPKSKPDTAKKEKAFTVEDAAAHYLRWSAQQGNTIGFTEWKQVQHPDFPGQKVEVGGLDPFVLINPPYKLVPDLVKKHAEFLVKLAVYQPEIDILNIRTEKLGSGITRITLDVVNKGAFASHSKLGERSYWVKRIRVGVSTTGNQSVLSGKKNQLLNSMEGYSSQQLTWLIKGTGKVTIEAGSPTTGTKKIEIGL